jgi:hypothetical protein
MEGAMASPKRLSFLILGAVFLLLAASPVVAKKSVYWRGKPAFAAGEAKGYYIWADGDGWHIRWTTKGKKHTFSGSVWCDGAVTYFTAVSREKKDYIKKTGRNRFRFDTVVAGGKDGVDFRVAPGRGGSGSISISTATGRRRTR